MNEYQMKKLELRRMRMEFEQNQAKKAERNARIVAFTQNALATIAIAAIVAGVAVMICAK